MPGILRIVLVLMYSRVFASDHLQPPKEIQLTVSNIGVISLSWKPCSGENATAERKYRVEVSAPGYYSQCYTSSCKAQASLSLHRGVRAKVATTIFKNDGESSSSESILAELPPSPGEDGTAAANLSCHINTEESLNISLTCSWTTGEKAPLDTQYSMYYRYRKRAEQCLQYVSEEDGQRHIGCRVPSSYIMLLDPQQQITVLINGSSRTRDIRSIDHAYNVFEIEVLNVPRNVTLQMKNGSQILVWTNPHSVYSNICFKYEVRVWNLWNNDYKIEEALEPKLENGPLQEPWKKHVFQVRAVTKILCMDTVLYSAWTEPLYIDTVSSSIYVVAACVCLILLSLFFMHICLRYQFCGQMFPPVPKPKKDLKELFLNVPPAPDFLVGERWDSWGGSVIISSIEVVCESEKFINPPVPSGDVHRPPS